MSTITQFTDGACIHGVAWNQVCHACRRQSASDSPRGSVWHAHNHGSEDGPGLACRETVIGDCLRLEFERLRNAEAQQERKVEVAALTQEHAEAVTVALNSAAISQRELRLCREVAEAIEAEMKKRAFQGGDSLKNTRRAMNDAR